jgi:hypothetical protein
MYFVDFVAVSLVSCIVMIVGFVVVFEIKLYMFDRVVFKDEAFHVMMYVLWLVVCIYSFCDNGVLGIGGRCKYYVMGSLHLRDSTSNFLSRNENLYVSS